MRRGLTLLIVAIALILVACHRRPLVIVLPGPIAHDIGLWTDDDLIYVALPPPQALYLTRRCVPMRTVRALILQTRLAIHVERL